jgi:hypothetical protein
MRASFEAMFSSGRFQVVPEQVRRVHTLDAAHAQPARTGRKSARPRACAPAGVVATNVYRARPRRAGGWWPTMPAPAPWPTRRRRDQRGTLGRCTDARLPGTVVAARRQRCRPSGALLARRHAGVPPRWQRERWTTPDGDFIDVDLLPGPGPGAPALVLFHGLEGSSRSHYAQAFAALARAARLGLRGAALPRLLGRAEPGAARLPLGRLRGDRLDPRPPARCARRAAARGGRLAGRQRAAALGPGGRRHRAARVAGRWPRCRRRWTWPPAGRAIDRGFNRLVYTRMFLRTMKPKALAKLAQHPGLFDRAAARRAHALRVRRRLHRAAARLSRHRRLLGARLGQAAPGRIRIPALVLNARNDPFVPGASLPRGAGGAGRCVTLWQPAARRPRGLSRRRFPGHVHGHAAAVCDWLAPVGAERPARQSPAMDEIVEAALRKWPNVPHCYGWLALDARGDWYMRDDACRPRGRSRRSRAAASARQAARLHPPQLRWPTSRRRVVLPERPAARVRRARGRALGLARRRRRHGW